VTAPLKDDLAGVGRPADLDAATVRWLAWHEARSHALAGREVRDLGDAFLLHDRLDREPFWNRLAGISWPDDPAAFDRRLTEALALFGLLDRIPHVWPQPGFDGPPDLVDRLLANGFEDLGAGILMVLDPARAVLEAQASRDSEVQIERLHGLRGTTAHDAAEAIAMVLGEAFSVEPGISGSIETEMAASLDHDEFHICLVRVDGEPAAVARRTTFAGASYLSSIGTRRSFRGRGMGTLVTRTATADAVAAGSRWIYLGVFAENGVARQMYERLGFTMAGSPSPDLLLRG
jgi:ribosomal protein S18 acetylase RimI-like enzyme